MKGNNAFATRLNALFKRVRHPGGREYTIAEVEKATGKKISAAYISHLRTGRRDNPTLSVVEALAKFFRVSPSYFFDYKGVEVNEGLTSEIALRSAQLSEADHQAILAMIDHILTIRGNDETEEGDEDKLPPESDQSA